MFKSYPEIENHYRNKEIQYFLGRCPEMIDANYIIEEKIDGACVSFIFGSDGSFSLAKRSGIVEANENFYNMQETVKEKYMDVIEVFRSYAKDNSFVMNVYGEFFGRGIQKRINYGDGKYVRFFDVRIDGLMISPYDVEDLFSLLNAEDMLVPNFGVVKGLYEAFEFDVENRTTLVYPEGGDFIEGVVIKPYESHPSLNRTYYYKKKSERFAERSKRREKKERKPVDSFLQDLHNSFREYVNENRVLSVFSKYGEIDDHKDIGKYIKLVLEDAKGDFLKDYDVSALDKNELKYVYNVGKDIVEILRKYL
jgi:Rnl2 family RNA ligase